MAHINSLSSDTLQAILSYLPLETLLQSALVCRHWYQTFLRVSQSGRQVLWLTVGDGAPDLVSEFHFPILQHLVRENNNGIRVARPVISEWSRLTLPSLIQKSSVDRLVRLFGGMAFLRNIGFW